MRCLTHQSSLVPTLTIEGGPKNGTLHRHHPSRRLGGAEFRWSGCLDSHWVHLYRLPKEAPDQLGIAQEGRRKIELADDRLVEYPIGYARMRLGDDQTTVLVVLGPEGISPMLGATALRKTGGCRTRR